MRLGIVTASISRQAGGLKDSVRREASCLNARGLAVTIHAVEDSDSAVDRKDWDSPSPVLSPRLGPSRFSYAPQLLPSLLNAGADVVSSHGLWRYTSMAVTQWHERSGNPYLVAPHGMLDQWALRHSKFKKRISAFVFENRHLRSASCIRALSLSERDAIRDYGLTNPIAIIPNGVDEPVTDSGSIARPWDKIPGFSEAKVALSLGRLHSKKNLIELLRAWKGLRESGYSESQRWRLVIAGWDDGGYESDLRRCADELELRDSVWFAGPLFGAEKKAAYRASSGFVVPSLSEGLPMVVLEAWSYGLPVVMTPQCNLPEGFAAGAAIRTTANAEDITHALHQLCGMRDDERITMGNRGRQLARQEFSWDRVAHLTNNVLEWITNQGSRPDCVSL